MAHSPETISAVRAAYVYEALNREAISDRFNVPVSTITRWKKDALEKGDDWDRARAAARLSGQGMEAVTTAVLEDFVLMFQSAMEEIKNAKDIKPFDKVEMLSKLSDAYAKTAAAMAKANPKLDKLSFAADILRDLVQYVQQHYPQHSMAMEQVLMPFSEEIGRRYG
ncbi:DUF1804 family protein [Nitrosomonas sp. Nm166]|uniref:DUF1804 family protein n=1 Tax=Nitrosomonas sp. Nm166 TaxID=1881054 RepID=UPI0008E3FFEC|nr:DUF1804 family protein [Nitrosomonas sp. Nm166]SFF13572.1 Protein of unknown function [Nitrosomonas sp. Nm166]